MKAEGGRLKSKGKAGIGTINRWMASCEWQMANGRWRMADGKYFEDEGGIGTGAAEKPSGRKRR